MVVKRRFWAWSGDKTDDMLMRWNLGKSSGRIKFIYATRRFAGFSSVNASPHPVYKPTLQPTHTSTSLTQQANPLFNTLWSLSVTTLLRKLTNFPILTITETYIKTKPLLKQFWIHKSLRKHTQQNDEKLIPRSMLLK